MPASQQQAVPRSFVELFLAPGAFKPSEPREVIAARYDLCEDMAQLLTGHARSKLFELGVAEEDVLERVQRGLLAEGSVVGPGEARWITRRLAELLNWPQPSSPEQEETS